MQNNGTLPQPDGSAELSKVETGYSLIKRKIDLSYLDTLRKKAEKQPLFKLMWRFFIHKQAGRWLFWMVVAPWLLVAIYYVGFASDRYVANATFMIEKNGGNAGGMAGINILGLAPQTGNDQKILESFIKSPDMLYYLDESIGLKKHYAESGDWFSSLSSNASFEKFLGYYLDHIQVHYNDSNGLLDLEVQGFTPEFAQQMADAILDRSEAFVNEISHNLANEQQKFVKQEVELSEQRLKAITGHVIDFQNETGLLSASEQGVAISGIMNELQAELIRNKAELQTLTSYLNANSSKVVGLKQRIAALEKQINSEKTRLTGNGDVALNDLVARQKELDLDLNLATQAYSSSLVALEQARTEASRKLKQLVVISSPHLSEDAKYPRALYNLTTLLLILLMVYGLVRMTRATIREHKD